MNYPSECPSCSGTMTNGQCDWSLCGLDLAALNRSVEPASTANLTDADKAALPVLISLGRNNPWVSSSYDPPFNERSFYRCTTRDELRGKFEHGNWSNGTAFLFDNLCFIEQGNSNEWLTIKMFAKGECSHCGPLANPNCFVECFCECHDRPAHAVAFESISWRRMIRRKPAEFDPMLDALLAATEEQCRNLTYK